MVYKIAHLSDLHIDYSSTKKTNAQGLNLRYVDGLLAFSKMITEIIEESIDSVIIAGDFFHSPKPSLNSIIFAQNQLRRLSKAKIPVYILAGNHDASDVKTEIASSRVLHDPQRKIYSHVEPYVYYPITDNIFIHLISHHMYDEQAETMKQVKPIKDSINILTTHGSCIDPILELKLHTEQSPREIVIPDFILQDYNWDYTMLGHIHERGWVGSTDGLTDNNQTKIYYNGSLIRRGFSDGIGKLGRGWTEWQISENGTFKNIFHNIAQRPQYDFDIIDAENKTSTEITDIIIQNLQQTQVNGKNFNSTSAPILRQKIKNIEPSKYAALDWLSINNNSEHALSWKIDRVNNFTTDINKNKDTTSNSNEEEISNNDIIKIYDNWTDKSITLDKTDSNIKDQVKKQTRDFIELGQEITLNE